MYSIDKNLTLEQLENDPWPAYDYESSLVEKCHEYRKIPLKDLTVEQLRLLLGQNIGNKFLIPQVLDTLKKDVMASGDYYEGDLLNMLLQSKKDFWLQDHALWSEACNIVNTNIERITAFNLPVEIKTKLLEGINNFKTYFV